MIILRPCLRFHRLLTPMEARQGREGESFPGHARIGTVLGVRRALAALAQPKAASPAMAVKIVSFFMVSSLLNLVF